MKKTYSNFSVAVIGSVCTNGNKIPKLTIFKPVESPKTVAMSIITRRTLKPDTDKNKFEKSVMTVV